MKDFGKIDPSRLARFVFRARLSVTREGAAELHGVIEFIASNLRAWGGRVKE